MSMRKAMAQGTLAEPQARKGRELRGGVVRIQLPRRDQKVPRRVQKQRQQDREQLRRKPQRRKLIRVHRSLIRWVSQSYSPWRSQAHLALPVRLRRIARAPDALCCFDRSAATNAAPTQ